MKKKIKRTEVFVMDNKLPINMSKICKTIRIREYCIQFIYLLMDLLMECTILGRCRDTIEDKIKVN